MAPERITIAGAGPSGLAAAIALARGGRPVTVLERAGTVGAKFIDGFQIVENYTSRHDALDDLRRGGIEPDFVLMPGHDVTYYDARLRPFQARSREPFGYLVKRGPGPGTLDSSLLKQAVDAGAEVLFERAAEIDKVDIIATGPRDATGVAREIVFKTHLPDGLRVLLDSTISRDGFAYLFVIGGQATLGVAILSDFGSLSDKTEAVIHQFQQLGSFDMIDPVVKSSYVNFFLPSKAASADGRIRVGEAAGFQDFLFGIGIRRTITSGLQAATQILEGVHYRAGERTHLVRLMDTSILNRLFYEMAGRVGFRPFLSVVGRFDFRRLGQFLTRPGPLKSLATRVVRAAWKNRKDCRHGPECGWCRKAG